jgi:hypothetical protein
MIRLELKQLTNVPDAQSMLQTAIEVEFGTLPPYLYALYSIRPGTNRTPAAGATGVAECNHCRL